MTSKSKAAYLGQEVFFLVQCEVVRTAVGSVSKEGYTFLDSRCPSGNHWFSYDRAVEAADVLLQRRQETLRRQIKALTRRRKIVKTVAYQDRVMNTPRRIEDLRDIERPLRAKHLKKLRVPETYLKPGQVVFVVVGPATKAEDPPLYRPYEYFVLETEVRKVCFTFDGELHYSLASPFRWFEFFLSREEAELDLRCVANLPLLAPVHFVSKEEFERESATIDTIPF